VRLLVSGGAGFIGSAFVRRRLASTSDEIVVLDKLTYAASRANLDALELDAATRDRFRFVLGDICDVNVVSELVDTADAIVNFAAESHVDRSILDSSAFLRTGVLGLGVLLDAAVAAERLDGRPRRLLQVSTDEVYGEVEDARSRESDVLDPRSPYSAAKAAGDLLVQAYHVTYGLDTVLTRGANTYGPRQHPEKFIPLFVTNAVDEQPLPLYGDGLQRREWLYVDDHADAISAVLDHGQAGGIYNVPGSDEHTNRSVAQTILDQLGKPWTLVRSVPDRRGHDRRYALDGGRLTSLGWRPKVAFERGLRSTIRWYMENESWWRAHKDADWDTYYERQYAWRLALSREA
jgi:dTDP-glucose 4,6-dehydratase